LAKKLIETTRARIIVIGSQSETALVRVVADAAGTADAADGGSRVRIVVGEPLARVIQMLSGAQVFIGTDGGLLHLANLAGTPTVGLYGPVSEIGYAPLASAAATQTVTVSVPCRPCYRNFKFTGCAYDKQCLTALAPQRVLEALARL
jgi:ADP-heptose:LPS heptosyltransferase